MYVSAGGLSRAPENDMLIYFLRHGDAVEASSLNDSERPLSDLGNRQAATVGRFLRANGIKIDAVLSSPLVRAVKTAEIVQQELTIANIGRSEFLVPGTDQRQLFRQISSLTGESVLLIGHEPHLSQTVSLLLSGHNHTLVEFKKCTLACLIASMPVRKEHALLQFLLTYQQMDLLGR